MGSVAEQLVCFLKYSWVAWVGLLLPYLACPCRDRVAQNQNFCFTVFSTHFRLSNFRLVFAVCLSVSGTNQEVYILNSAVTHKSMCTISLSNCFTLNFVYSLQFESLSSVCFLLPSLCLPLLYLLRYRFRHVFVGDFGQSFHFWGGQMSSGLGFLHPYQIGDSYSGCFQIRCLEDMALIQL